MLKVREPIVEGIFYPSDPRKLNKLVTALLENAAAPRRPAWGLIAPHAGYRYSGAIAAAAYKAASDQPVKTVVFLAPIHRTDKDEVIFPESEMFKMPGGLIPVNQCAVEEMLSCSTQFVRDDIPHLEEHSIEVQLPFVPALFPKADILPILVGKVGRKTVTALARALAMTFEKSLESTLFVVSANLTSFMQGRDASSEAKTILDALCAGDADRLLTDHERGRINSIGVPAMAALMLLADGTCDIELLSSGSSAETNHDFKELVHYAAIGFFRKQA